jgi:hypothetical protein
VIDLRVEEGDGSAVEPRRLVARAQADLPTLEEILGE